jgi:hypothetical protein
MVTPPDPARFHVSRRFQRLFQQQAICLAKIHHDQAIQGVGELAVHVERHQRGEFFDVPTYSAREFAGQFGTTAAERIPRPDQRRQAGRAKGHLVARISHQELSDVFPRQQQRCITPLRLAQAVSGRTG